MVVLQSISFANYALTTKTTNIIYGSAPYLTFDGGRTRVTNTEALLWISLSDGRKFTPTTNNSSYNPIVLPVAGQSFNDIGMLVPTNTDSIALSSLIGTPYNYWGDDDGDGKGIDGVTATGSLNLSIYDKDNNPVARNEVLNICKAPYKLMLSNDGGTLKTRYGVPNESRFTAGRAIYYIKPKASPAICFAQPGSRSGNGIDYAGPAPTPTWDSYRKFFLIQSVTPSSYGLNFPTTGAHNLYFDLIFAGTNQALSWAPVSHGGIKATMTNSTSTSVRVILSGPHWYYSVSEERRPPSLPQVFELVGRDSSGNAVVKYGFELKQWFFNNGNNPTNYSNVSSFCNHYGYRLPKVKDLTNASCQRWLSGPECQGAVGATPSSSFNEALRHIGAGFFTEWGEMRVYSDTTYYGGLYWTSDRPSNSNDSFLAVSSHFGGISSKASRSYSAYVACVYP
ncbi:hypothetical protein B6D06_00310 [Gilliamella apis]|uniref:Uncharacterized protein n=1 Tax=Gilliamella apis TaxID=1970738 RepID=A0A242NYP0_9GAMM|nr:hypothetical protein B6D06_00310 [Gilliamella apis]